MTSQQTRYSYGGHLTFPVRYGWLPKGLARLVETGAFTPTTEAADELGLGSKMVESLGFWLRAMGLTADDGTARTRSASDLAAVITARDRFCELPGTWWFLHLMLATLEGSVWSWFFNAFGDRLFDRVSCADAFLQHTRSHAQRAATPAVAQKDVACLLSSYAARLGVDYVDPEDLGACPLRELGLVLRHDHVNRFERTRSPVGVPAEALLACVSSLAEASGRDAFPIRELAIVTNGPGRVFCAGLDALEAMVGNAVLASPHARLDSLAGERQLVIAPRPTQSWMRDFYDRIGTSS